MESGACPPFIKPSKQDEDRDCDLIPILSSKQFTFQSHLISSYIRCTSFQSSTILSSENSKMTIIPQSPQKYSPHMIGG